MTTLRVQPNIEEYHSVLNTLEEGSFWPRDWARQQYIGLVLTAMCTSVVHDRYTARRYAVLRVMEVLLEHRHNLLPRTTRDLDDPRGRVSHLAIPYFAQDCEQWIDILEYIQIRNWQRKEPTDNYSERYHHRIEVLRSSIATNFSPSLVDEIETFSLGWWVVP